MITAESLEQAVEKLPQENLPSSVAGLLNLMRMLGMRDTGQSEHMS